MNTTSLALVALLVPAVAILNHMRRSNALPDPAPSLPARTRAPHASRTNGPAARQPRLTPIEWDAPRGATPIAATSPRDVRTRARDEYIAARFPGVFRRSADLLEVERVIKVARLLFEEGELGRADELFALAIEESPAARALRLAQLEIAFLTRNAPHFIRLAGELQREYPELAEWPDVVRLGHALAPGEPLFGADPGARENDHYGPWPDLPNWIHASWDLTPEVLAVDFHNAMSDRIARGSRAALRRVA